LAEQVCELDSYEKGFLNALIIEAGYSYAYTKFPFQKMERFRELEKQARQNNRGLWKEKGLQYTFMSLIFWPILTA
jgi:endonuclease YncB( thermonuclease family)